MGHVIPLSSANLMKRLELCDGVQSWVSRVKRRGLSTHPWGAPVFSVMVLDVFTADPYCLRSSRSESPTASCTATCWAPAGSIYEWAVEGWLCWMLNWSLWTAIWHTCLFCPDVWGLGGGQWRWHHRSSGLDLYANWKGSREGGRTDLMCCMTSCSKHSWE